MYSKKGGFIMGKYRVKAHVLKNGLVDYILHGSDEEGS